MYLMFPSMSKKGPFASPSHVLIYKKINDLITRWDCPIVSLCAFYYSVLCSMLKNNAICNIFSDDVSFSELKSDHSLAF